MAEFRYKAFISYSHKNNRQAAWLMKKLEAFRIPRYLNDGALGPLKQNKLGKMFRDREELPASTNMDGNIRSALKESEYLIVVCSRSAARSARVNNEIRQFIQHRDSRKILCFIVDGEPNFEVAGLKDYEGCIPSELRKLRLVTGQTPLAADTRIEGDGKHRALQKIIAGLIEVDLDALLRRDSRRKYSRLLAVALASFLGALIMTGLMLRANLAEDAAKQALSRAENQTDRAEDLITFMLDDLAGNRLKELGRVEVMDAVVAKIVDHYESQDDSTLSPDALARKARSYTQLGRLYLGRDLRDPANSLFQRAYAATKSLFKRYPERLDARFTHAVSMYWIGLNHIFNGRYSAAESIWRERVLVGEKLWEVDSHASNVWGHMADMNVHVGWALMELGRPQEALAQFQIGLERRQANASREPDVSGWLNPLAGGYYHLQWAQRTLGMLEEAYENSTVSNDLYKKVADEDPTNQQAAGNLARSFRWRAETEIALERYDDAAKHLKQSLSMYQQLLSFEPENRTFGYQACVSYVVLAELYWARGNAAAADKLLDRECREMTTHLSLDHFKVHQRFHGYRLAILRLKKALADQDFVQAKQLYRQLSSRWVHESEETQQSLKGSQIALSLAIQRVALNEFDGSVPDANAHLAAMISDVESSFLAQSPTGVKLLEQARTVALQASTSEAAR